jgi:iron(III) transport system ATP-binding protein
MDDVLYELSGVSVGRRGERLDDVSVRLRPGVTAVLGPSGAGKTTLLNLLVRFERPDAGSVTSRVERGAHSLPLYWVPQDGGLWPHLSVREHLETVLPDRAQAGRADGLLEAFDLTPRAAARPDELSMGERARLAVARALAADAAVLVMDEPLAHVDQARAPGYWRSIREELRAGDASLIFATHSARLVLGEAQRVICIGAGRLLYEGEVERLYREPKTRQQAELLGDVNWLEDGEAQRWLGASANGRPCYRPEQVEVARAEAGPLVVRACRFMGSVAEAEVEDERTGERRRFYHRPVAGGLRPGDRVILKALLMLLLAVVIGCGRGGDPALSMREEHHWAVPAEGAVIPAVRSVSVGPGDEVYALDTGGRVLVFGPDGALRRQWRMPETGKGNPEGVCVLQDGRVAVCDTHYSRLVFFDRDGKVLRIVGREGRGEGEFIYPVGITQGGDGSIYVCEYGGNDRIQRFSPQGDFLQAFGSFGTGPGAFQRPSGMAWRDGTLYVADAINNRIQAFSSDGRFLGVLGGARPPALEYPYDIVIGAGPVLYAIEYGAGRLTELGLDGRVLGRYGSAGRGDAQFSTPWGIAVDSRGRLLVADQGNRRIVELSP